MPNILPDLDDDDDDDADIVAKRAWRFSFTFRRPSLLVWLGCRIRLSRAQSVIAACVSSQSIFLVGSSFGRRSSGNST